MCKAIGNDHRRLGFDESFRCLFNGTRIALRWTGLAQSWDLRRPAVDFLLLQVSIQNEHRRSPRRRHRDAERAHRRFGEMRQRFRRVVPFGEIAHHCDRVLSGMDPFDPRPTMRGIEMVTRDDDNGHVIAPGVVERHRSMLKPDSTVAGHQHRFASHLEVAMRDRDGVLFVQAGQDFRFRIAAVVDE